MTRVITLEDCRRHQPGPGAPPSWQESFYLGWVDRKNRICGTHHISLAPGPGRDTHVWSWVMVEGKVLAIGTPEDIRSNRQVLDAYLGN